MSFFDKQYLGNLIHIDTVSPVSYTHLDVYKRQAFMRAHERVRERVGAAFRANFGREPTEAELQTISLNAVNLELEQIIHRAIETAARHGAKTPALYIASILSLIHICCRFAGPRYHKK